MKKFFILSFFILSFCAFAKPQVDTTPDIVVVSKLDADWSKVLITKIRTILSNFKILDPFKYAYDGELVIGPTEARTLLPASSTKLLNDLGNVLGLDFFKAQAQASMTGFAYEVKGFKTDLNAAENIGADLVIKTGLSASEVFVQASKITISVKIPTQNGESLPVIAIDIIKPVIEATNENLVKLFAKLRIHNELDSYSFKIDELNLNQMADNLSLKTGDVKINYEKIVVPKVSIKIGDKRVDFSQAKIQQYLRNNHEGLKGILLSQLAKILRKGTADAVQKGVQNFKMPKKYWMMIPTIKTMVNFTKITNFPVSNTLQLNLDGDFCADDVYLIYKELCVSKRLTKVSPSRLNDDNFQASLAMLNEIIQKDEIDMVASVSEDYLNKLLATTIDAGLWTEALKTAGIELGPNKVSLRLDKQGNTGTFILDGIYRPRKLERIALGVSVIRFPLALSVAFKIQEQNDDEPVLVVTVVAPDTSDETLLHGLPQYGVESSIGTIRRFQGKVLSTIRYALKDFNNRDMVTLPVTQLKGLNLDKAEFHSDGLGRMYGTISLQNDNLIH
jgi:hypothetical protein